MHSFTDRLSAFCSFLRWFRFSITSDWVFLIVGVFFLRCKRVVSVYHCCFCMFPLVVDFWSEELLRNKCHLAAKLGTKLADLLQRSSLPYVSHIVGGCYYSCFSWQTLFFSVIEMFSVLKGQKSILICHWCRQQLYMFMYGFNLDCEV